MVPNSGSPDVHGLQLPEPFSTSAAGQDFQEWQFQNIRAPKVRKHYSPPRRQSGESNSGLHSQVLNVLSEYGFSFSPGNKRPRSERNRGCLNQQRLKQSCNDVTCVCVCVWFFLFHTHAHMTFCATLIHLTFFLLGLAHLGSQSLDRTTSFPVMIVPENMSLSLAYCVFSHKPPRINCDTQSAFPGLDLA